MLGIVFCKFEDFFSYLVVKIHPSLQMGFYTNLVSWRSPLFCFLLSSTTQSTSSLHLSSSWPGRPGCNSSFSFLALRTQAWRRLALRSWVWGAQRPAWAAPALGEGDLEALVRARVQAWGALALAQALALVLACKENQLARYLLLNSQLLNCPL